MPQKRNRDDEQEQEKKQQAPSTGVVVVKKESTESEAPEDHRRTGDLDRKDKKELKKWVKELLKENLDLNKEKDELKEQHAKANIAHKLHTLFNTVFDLPRSKGENPVFYPNPYLVEAVVKHEVDDTFCSPRSTREQKTKRRYFKTVKGFSEIASAFKDVDALDGEIDHALLVELFAKPAPRFHLHIIFYNDSYLVVGATAPYNYKFSKEIQSWDVYQEVQSKYSDTDLRLNFDLPTGFGGTVVLYPDCTSRTGPKNFWFNEKDDVVNFLLSSAPSYDSKVKGYLPKTPADEDEAVEVLFDLDTMTVKGKKLSERGFSFEYHGWL